MKRLSLISLLWLVAVVAAFFGGRASNERKVREAKGAREESTRKQIEAEILVTQYQGFDLYPDAFAANLEEILIDLGVDSYGKCTTQITKRDLMDVVDLDRLPVIHPATPNECFVSYALTANHTLRVDFTTSPITLHFSQGKIHINDAITSVILRRTGSAVTDAVERERVRQKKMAENSEDYEAWLKSRPRIE